MDDMTNKTETTFEYTYSAREQAEIESIRKKYLPKEDSKMEQLRKLDKSVEVPGTVVSIALGILGALVMGAGMSFCMVWTDSLLVPGIVIGILGMVLIGLAYPVFRKVTTRQREKLAPQILALTEELTR